MKKLLGLLGAVGLVATTSATVVACGQKVETVSLTATKLSAETVVKSKKITADGTITFKLAEKSVLTVKVKEKSQKAGEVTIIISTTADKLTDKEVKETIDVMHKAKDASKSKSTKAAEPVKVASVEVKIGKKGASTAKVKLDTVDLSSFKATNDTTDAQVIDALKAVKGLDKLTSSDITITKTKATTSATGSIKIDAKSTSTIVEGTKTLVIDKLEAPAELVDLSTVNLGSFKATNDTTDAQVIDALKAVKGLEKLTTSDVTITKTKATTSAAGSIKIDAKSDSKIVKGTKTLEIAKLEAPATLVDLSTVNLGSFKATNDTTDAQIVDALKAVKGLEKLTADDVSITKTKATKEATGSIKIDASLDSKIVKGAKTLTIDKLSA
ncbi:lipoprotein [Spiroplasma floricola]|uniref:Lipoprotein n=1 Tax=Spiroplasma floricola 23-6 TaxID=1336749 RepID=A0A2K8SED3_9MOLU|nr:lipoprotein [Spiroplasma floricola]AUB31792.1 hypothetical protein SFLOR_v1c07440 [Spiroplasma floricola 23-6]